MITPAICAAEDLCIGTHCACSQQRISHHSPAVNHPRHVCRSQGSPSIYHLPSTPIYPLAHYNLIHSSVSHIQWCWNFRFWNRKMENKARPCKTVRLVQQQQKEIVWHLFNSIIDELSQSITFSLVYIQIFFIVS